MPEQRPPEEPWDVRTQNVTREEEGAALAIGAAMKPLYDHVKATLPPGAHFAIIVDVPETSEMGGRIMTLATNRLHMADLAIQWAMSVIGARS